MDYTPTNPTKLSPSDLLNEDTDDMTDFAAPPTEALKADAVEKAQNFRSYAGEKATAMKQEAGVKIKQGAEKAKELHVSAEDYIKENPTKSVLSAVGVGVIIGLILRR
jgi:ElaB/YqjD/DUF883 family membrane-anchored ribosome-binding protein